MAFVVICGVVSYRYYDYMVQSNYVLTVQTVCDPSVDKCFVTECDIESGANCDLTPYKKVAVRAAEAPACLAEHSCTNFECVETDMPTCVITYCEKGTLENGEVCLATRAHNSTP